MFRADVLRLMIGYPVEEEKNPGTTEYDRQQIRMAMTIARSLGGELKLPVWLITNDLRDLGPATDIEHVIGAQRARQLKAGRGMTLPGGLQVFHATPKTKSKSPSGLALFVHPTQETLESEYLNFNVKVELVIPWYRHHVQSWIDTWGPVHLIGADERVRIPKLELEDPEIVAAVDSALSLGGLSNPGDERRARDTFAALRRRNKVLDPRAIRAYALRSTGHGIPTAEKLVKIAIGRSRQ